MIATNTEQSRRLLELGIKMETADMIWTVTNDKPILCDDLSCTGIPAWSLSALLELLPHTIKLCEESPIYIHGIYRTSEGYAMDYYNNMNGNRIAIYTGSNLLDVAVEMIKWLYSGYLRKEKEK